VVQYELSKAQEAASESERSADSSAQTAQRLAESANTVRLLQEKLKEKESVINKVGTSVHSWQSLVERGFGVLPIGIL
jgi:hypothetical protein